VEKFMPILKRSKLFAGVGEDEIRAMLGCLQVVASSYKKGEYVFRQGQNLQQIALLVEGSLMVQKEDYWGNRSIIQSVEAGEMFGEAYAAPESGPLLSDVVAVADSTVLLFDVFRVLTVCSAACRFHSMVVQNLVFAVAEKNRYLVQKLGHMAKRSTREKLISYLSEEAKRQGSSVVTIPFNRQQLADFLSVDRSAMSNELGKMRDDGLIEFEKNRFTLL